MSASLALENTNSIGGNPGGSALSSSTGVRVADGSNFVAGNWLSSSGFGANYGQSATWTNQVFATNINAKDPQSPRLGSGWIGSYQPWLSQDGKTIVAIDGADNYVFFDPDGSGGYKPRYFFDDTLQQVGNTLVMTDTSGNKITFHDFSSSTPVS